LLAEQQRCEHPPSPGPLNRRVLCSCLVPQCSYRPHRPRHQRRHANYDWMPASYTSGQPSNPRRHSTGRASSQWSHTVSSTPCHGAGHLLHSALTRPSSANARRLKSRQPCVPAAQHLISSSDNNIRAAQWADHQWNAEWADNLTRLRSPRHWHPTPWMTLPRKACVRLNHPRTGDGRFRSCLYKWGMAPAWRRTNRRPCCLQFSIHRPAHGLAVLDDETTEWLLNICPEI